MSVAAIAVETPTIEAAVDGGKVRLRSALGAPCIGRDYEASETDTVVVADFQNNASLIDWLNSQSLATPLTCLGDSHDGGLEYRCPDCDAAATA